MSSYIFIMKDIVSESHFNKDKICKSIKRIKGTYNYKEDDENRLSDMVMECEYQFDNDSTIIYVPRSLKYVTIGGTGESSLNAAIHLQKNYGEELFAILADDPSYHTELSEVQSTQVLRNRLGL